MSEEQSSPTDPQQATTLVSEEQSTPTIPQQVTAPGKDNPWIILIGLLLVVVLFIFIIRPSRPYALSVVVAVIGMWLWKYFWKPMRKKSEDDGYSGLKNLIRLVAIFVAILGTILLYLQNNLLDNQNRKIDTQIVLEEANRRSSYAFILGNLLDKIDRELDSAKQRGHPGEFSIQMIARIKAISQGLKPYRYLEGSILIEVPLSPERGQLLLALSGCGMDSFTLDTVFSKVFFYRADLKEAEMNNAILKGAHLNFANFSKANLDSADLSKANLSGTIFTETILSRANLSDCDLSGTNFSRAKFPGAKLMRIARLDSDLVEPNFFRCNFSSATLDDVYLERSNLSGVNFRGAILSNVHLRGADLNGVDFQDSKLTDVDLRSADLKGANFNFSIFKRVNFLNSKRLNLEKLAMADTLSECQGINETMMNRMKIINPKLYVKLSDD